VGEPGALEVLVEHRVHRARVAHDQPGQQPGRPLIQDPPGGGRPAVGRREQQHGGVQPVRDRPVGQSGDRGIRDDPSTRRTAERARVGVQLEDEHDRPAGLGDGTER
jgi:hypothetical protein